MKPMTLRLPDELHAALVKHAVSQGRSTHAQAIEAVERDVYGPRSEAREMRDRKPFKPDFKDPPAEKKGRFK